jgi:PAS domain-containing protein
MALLNAGKINGFQMEKRYLHHDGAADWINMTIAKVAVADTAHPRHLCMIKDITERKRANEFLKSSEEKFAKVFQTSFNGITITAAKDGKIIDVNNAFYNDYGFQQGRGVSRFINWPEPVGKSRRPQAGGCRSYGRFGSERRGV